MPRFSQRLGVIPVRSAIQGRDLDEVTRTRLWNAFAAVIPQADASRSLLPRTWMKDLYQDLWASLGLAIDELPPVDKPIRDFLKSQHLTAEWYEVYDLVEFTLKSTHNQKREQYCQAVECILRDELAGFRILEGDLVEITDENELRALEESLAATAQEKFAPSRAHLGASLALLSDRRAPDYRNAIKEAICAVEAVVQTLVDDPKAELAAGLRLLEKEAPVHGALKRALLALYGYTSDAEGIRHALSDEPNLDAADAKFMLVTCAAFVVYLIQKAGATVS